MRPIDAFAARRPCCPISTALLLAAACGKEQPSPAWTRPTSTASRVVPAGELAYVTNEDSQELTVIDTRTDSVVATIPVGTRPRGVRISPDGKTVFVALSGSPKCPPTMPDEECEKLKSDKSKDGIAVVDVATQQGDPGPARRIRPGDVRYQPGRVYPVRLQRGCPHRIDRGRRQRKGPVHRGVGKEPEGVRLQPDGAAVWVTGETDHNLTLHRHQDRQSHGAGQRRETAPRSGVHPRR